MNMMNSAYETYRQQGVMTANAVDLVIMLYNGSIKQLKIARIAIQEKRYEQVNIAMKKAQDIILELNSSLDMSFEISKNLNNLYEFILQEMVRINIGKDADGIAPIVEIMESLRDAWTEIKKQPNPTMAYYED